VPADHVGSSQRNFLIATRIRNDAARHLLLILPRLSWVNPEALTAPWRACGPASVILLGLAVCCLLGPVYSSCSGVIPNRRHSETLRATLTVCLYRMLGPAGGAVAIASRGLWVNVNPISQVPLANSLRFHQRSNSRLAFLSTRRMPTTYKSNTKSCCRGTTVVICCESGITKRCRTLSRKAGCAYLS
jgi:hypothetical protein